MATIIPRTRKDGSVAYMAQIRIKREGRVVFSANETFDREAAARAWAKKREAELAKPGALDDLARPTESLSDLIGQYLKLKGDEIGRTKAQVLRTIQTHDIAAMPVEDIASKDLVEWARWLGVKRQPQTVQNYMSHLAAVLSVARAAWGKMVDRSVMRDATEAARHFGLVQKSAKRERRPTLDELDRLMAYFGPKPGIPMQKIVAFAVYSSRRQEEITRLLWADFEPGRILVRDMKHPGQKAGNDVRVTLVPEAEAVIRSMPKVDARIFPFEARSISASFTRACHFLQIDDLTFHDLRHEAASRLFEMGMSIPQAADVTGHRTWASLQRYSHLRQTGDKLAGWPWLARIGAN